MTMTEQYQISEYTQTAAAIAILREKHSGPFEVTTTKGMDEAKKARAEVKGYRIALEKLRVELKAPALERSRLIDAEAKRITAELLAIEEPIDEAIKAEEKRKEEEKAAKARAEAARLAGIADKISAIRNWVSTVANQPAEVIEAELENALALELSVDDFQEFLPGAQEALIEARQAMQLALENRIAYEEEQARIKAEQEAEAARIKAEREELARLRELEAARQAEQARVEAEARKAEEARLQQEREQQEAELKAKRAAMEAEFKAQREEQARKEEAIRQQQAVEAARIKAEQEAMERQRAELEAQQRKLEEAEQARLQAEQAKVVKLPRKGKATDPIADLKQALNANAETAKALDEAYQRGFQAGMNSAQQAA